MALALICATAAGSAVLATAPTPAMAATGSCSQATAPDVIPSPDPQPAVPPVVQDVADGGVVFYLTHYWTDYTVRGLFSVTVDVVSTATATDPATIDPSSVDVDPATDGIQHLFNDGRIEATVDPVTGLITVTGVLAMYSTVPDSMISQLLQPLAYTITDSNGTVSNIATITFSYTYDEVSAT
ncbi:MAG: hypothetical protein QM598_05735 [Protaetiibacter sp.]